MSRKHDGFMRPGEKVGGGFFVARRGRRTGRVSPMALFGAGTPYEHPSFESAMDEASRLAHQHPGYRFQVLGVVGEVVKEREMEEGTHGG